MTSFAAMDLPSFVRFGIYRLLAKSIFHLVGRHDAEVSRCRNRIKADFLPQPPVCSRLIGGQYNGNASRRNRRGSEQPDASINLRNEAIPVEPRVAGDSGATLRITAGGFAAAN